MRAGTLSFLPCQQGYAQDSLGYSPRSGAIGLRGIYGGYGEIIRGLVVSNSQFKAYAKHIYIHIHKFSQGSRF